MSQHQYFVGKGFRHQGGFVMPPWVSDLHYLYWVLRVEKPTAAKRRHYYRKVAEKKLQLVEAGVSQELVEAVCRYMVSLTPNAGRKMTELMLHEGKQLRLDFG